MTSELDRAFADWPSLRWPSFGQFVTSNPAAWSPKIDVFERDNRLVTRVDLPGMKKEELSVELTDGGDPDRICLALAASAGNVVVMWVCPTSFA
jgi:HSP20 family molecular chaperone IbpA